MIRSIKSSLAFTNINVLLISFVAFVDMTGIGLIIPVRALYAREMGADLFQLGLMASVFMLAEFLFQIPFGRASDKFGRRRMMLFGMAIRTLMPILYFTAASNAWMFIAFRFIDGIGASAVLPAARAYLMDSVPQDRRGEAFGILGMGASSGLLLGPAIGGYVAAWGGLNAPYVFGAAMSALTLIIIYFRIFDREHKVEAFNDAPKASSLAVFRRYFGWPLAAALILAVGLNFGYGLMVTLWSIWLADMGAKTDYIGLTFVFFTVPMILLSGIGGRLSDKLGRVRFIIVGGIVAAITHGAYGLVGPSNYIWPVLLIGVVEGIAFAFAQPAIDGYLADIIPADARGELQGIYNTVGLGVAFISATIMAKLYEFNRTLPFISIAVVEIVCFLVGGLIAARYHRPLAAKTEVLSDTAKCEPASNLVLAD